MNLRRFLPSLLAAFSVAWAAIGLVATVPAPQTTESDAVGSWDEHMGAVSRALPPGTSVVGYLDGHDLNASIPGDEQEEFYLTQYALAPAVVLPGVDHEWIVGNFGNALTRDEIASALDQRLRSYSLDDLGFGIYLIHRPTK